MNRVPISPIQNTDELGKWFKQSETMLIIFDAHRNWSGRCETLLPSFQALCYQYDRCEDRLAFLSMETPKFAKEFESNLVSSPQCSIQLPNSNEAEGKEVSTGGLLAGEKGCMPLFLAIKSRKLVATVLGADYPALAKLVQEHIPSISGEDEIEDQLQESEQK